MVSLISKIINPVIWLLGAGVLAALIYYMMKFRDLGGRLFMLLNGTHNRTVLNPRTLALRQRESAPAKREDVDQLREEHNGHMSSYLTWSQIIPLFPLLGILGTVSGLLEQVVAQDIDALYAALNTALSSTFYGLIFAIGLKIVDVFVLKQINRIESDLESYELKYQDAITMRKFDEEAGQE